MSEDSAIEDVANEKSFDDWVNELRSIENGLVEYSSSSLEEVRSLFPLEKLAKQYEHHPQRGKLFAALLDLKLTHYFASNDYMYSGGLFNEQLHPKVVETKSQEQLMGSKITFLRHLNCFVLRCRSFWDKALGVLVLVYAPDEYERFLKGGNKKSRRSEFKKIMAGFLTKETLESIDATIGLLDDKFRTAEAHQTGILRKLILHKDQIDLMNSPLGWLLTSHNVAVEFARQLSALLLGETAKEV